MAVRKLRINDDPILRKKSKTVKEINDNILTLVQDMKETLEKEEGVGLAAVQVGSLRRVILVQPIAEEEPKVLINAEIVEQSGCELGTEGCLSIPGMHGSVERPTKIKVKAMNIDGEDIEFVAEDFEARIICHEVDHTNGILYTDKIYKDEVYYDNVIEESDI